MVNLILSFNTLITWTALINFKLQARGYYNHNHKMVHWASLDKIFFPNFYVHQNCWGIFCILIQRSVLFISEELISHVHIPYEPGLGVHIQSGEIKEIQIKSNRSSLDLNFTRGTYMCVQSICNDVIIVIHNFSIWQNVGRMTCEM